MGPTEDCPLFVHPHTKSRQSLATAVRLWPKSLDRRSYMNSGANSESRDMYRRTITIQSIEINLPIEAY